MKIDEINKRIHELEVSIELLEAIKRDFVADGKEEIILNAFDDGIKYTKQRLEQYKTADWIMLNE